MFSLIFYVCSLIVFFCVTAYCVYMYYVGAKKFKLAVRGCSSNDTYNRPYYCLKDEVAQEMLFSPFFAQNTACAIRQVQELVKNPQMFPKGLKPEDVSLYYVFTINGKSLSIVTGSSLEDKAICICSCDELELKKAYQLHKEIK